MLQQQQQQSIENSYPYGDACYPFIHSLTFIATLMAGVSKLEKALMGIGYDF
jgi:hypothetical protein